MFSGQYNFFILAILLIVLVPFTIAELRAGFKGNQSGAIKAPCSGWNRKDAAITSVRRRKIGLKKRHALLLIGWSVVAYTVHKASFYKLEAALYDPFKILDIATVRWPFLDDTSIPLTRQCAERDREGG